MSIAAFDSTHGSRGVGRLFLCARRHVQTVRPRPSPPYSWMRPRSSTGGATGGWPALSSERLPSCNPRLPVLSLSSSAEGRDASWFTTCVCNGIGDRRLFSWPRSTASRSAPEYHVCGGRRSPFVRLGVLRRRRLSRTTARCDGRRPPYTPAQPAAPRRTMWCQQRPENRRKPTV